MVKAGGTVYTIPTSVVTRVMEIKLSDLVNIQAGQAVMLDNKAIPAFELASLLEVKGAKIDANHLLSVVIITKDWKSIALLVEEIIGEREIVIKRLQSPLISVRNVAGGSLTGNGEVMVVLNPTDLINSAMHHSTLVRAHETVESEKPTERQRVLIVDDSITTRTLEKNILEAHGYLVTTAVDGLQGWEALNQGVFDLVVTDVEMPQLDGFQLAERIKTSDTYGNIPVVIVTSLAKESDRRRGIAVGADAYIVKGQFETKVLLDVIHQLI
jgi:CheY-like chemotaxis protein